MNILFYTPVNFRCREIESLTEKLIAKGYKVFFLSQCPPGPFHESMERLGAEISVMESVPGNSMMTYLGRTFRLIRFCRLHKIDVCLSHLEPTNFISVLAQPFLRTRFIIYRHHIDEAKLRGFDRSIAYRMTYRLAKTIICVSRQAREYAIREENVSPGKIFHINLGYDFNLYGDVDKNAVNAIRKEHAKGLLLLSAGRLTEFKRPSFSLELVKKAKDEGIDCSIIFLGVGEEEIPLRKIAADYSISDRVAFIGYTNRILDYMAAADLLVHPSILESSCVVVKEAALVQLPVIVCKSVGDFDDYMKNGMNGVVVPRENFVDEAFIALQNYSVNPKTYKEMAARLRSDILRIFNIDTVFKEYEKLIGV